MTFIKCKMLHLEQRCAERKIPMDIASGCIVQRDGDDIVVNIRHPSYPRSDGKKFAKVEKKPLNAGPSHGPGTELKKLLKKVGITASPTCSCNARARLMDERGIEWCEANVDEIVGWLREEATKRGLPFVDMAGKMLVKRAIKNARKATIQ